MPPKPSQRPSITDSPWYWAYLFATAALIALFLMGPKYAARQTQIEDKAEARQQAAQAVAGTRVSTADPPSDAETRITLLPLYVILAGVLLMAWLQLGIRHRRDGRTADTPSEATT